MKKRTYLLTLAAVAMLALTSLTGCGGTNKTVEAPIVGEMASTEIAEGGVLCLKVNPEIAISYDNEGLVTNVEARNDDGKVILEDYTGYTGKETRQVVKDLVTAIGDAGYFVEEVEGESRQITIEIEVGSKIPHETFIDDVVADIKDCVNTNDWSSPIALEGNTDYGITDYVDTDYGPDNDGVTDYDDTDYGPNNDGVTDYDDTDYGPNNDGVTDYDNGDSNYGNSNYDDGNSNYNDGNSNYDDGGSNYDSDSGYDD